jgi:hypothetical protein
MQSKAHLNEVGFEEIKRIKSGMNNQRQNSINKADSYLENDDD